MGHAGWIHTKPCPGIIPRVGADRLTPQAITSLFPAPRWPQRGVRRWMGAPPPFRCPERARRRVAIYIGDNAPSGRSLPSQVSLREGPGIGPVAILEGGEPEQLRPPSPSPQEPDAPNSSGC